MSALTPDLMPDQQNNKYVFKSLDLYLCTQRYLPIMTIPEFPVFF